MTDITLRTDLLPDEPDTSDWEPMIREALAVPGAHLRTVIEHDAITLDLQHCAYPDGTPIWDKPLTGHSGALLATRPDGQSIEILTEDGHGWDDLASRLDGLMQGWSRTVMVAMSELVHTERKIVEMERQLRGLKSTRIEQAKAARAAGARPWAMSKAVGRNVVTVQRWIRAE